MATLSTLDPTAPLDSFEEPNARTLARLEANPLTAALAPPFAALHTQWQTTAAQEQGLYLAVVRAEERVNVVDADLDGLVDDIARAVLTATGGKRTDDLYLHYFGAQVPSEIKRPILGAELDTVRTWPASLQTAPYPALVTLGNTLAAKITEADAAVTALTTARSALDDFRDLGGHHALFDKANATRKSTFGSLGDLAHSHPELNLPADFPETFFLQEKRRRRLTVEEIQARVDDAQKKLDGLQQQLAQAKATRDAEQQSKAKAQADEDKAALAQAQKEAADTAAKIAALKAKLGLP